MVHTMREFGRVKRGFAAAIVLFGVAVAGCKSEKKDASPVELPAAPLPAARSAPPVLYSTVENVPAPPDVAQAPPDAQKTSTGVATKVLQPGTGSDHPHPGDVMRMNYVGWKKDGTMFDRSVGVPVDLSFGQLFPGWSEGLQLMVAGEKRRIWVPASLAFGDHAAPGTPSGDITMDVELVKILRTRRTASSASAAASDAPPNAPKIPK